MISKHLKNFLKMSEKWFPNFLGKHPQMQKFFVVSSQVVSCSFSEHFFEPSWNYLRNFLNCFQNFIRFLSSFSMLEVSQKLHRNLSGRFVKFPLKYMSILGERSQEVDPSSRARAKNWKNGQKYRFCDFDRYGTFQLCSLRWTRLQGYGSCFCGETSEWKRNLTVVTWKHY